MRAVNFNDWHRGGRIFEIMELPHSLYSVKFETPFCKADKNAYPYNIAMSFNLDLESAKEAIWI